MPRLAVSLAVLLSLALGFEASAPRAEAQAATLRLPFAAGTAWKVVQGYNGGTHSTPSERYALDLVRDGDGPTAGVDVLAPAAGTVWWMNPPGSGNGCVLIKLDGGSGLIVELCHVFARSFRTDERVEAGQVVGTIGPAGTVGNNGLAHLHLSMHRTPDYGVTRIAAPFAAPDGLPLDGVALPADGTANQYACPGAACRAGLLSNNGRALSSSPGAGAAAVTFGAPAPIAAAPVTAVTTPLVALRAGVVARVSGAGDCLNVREGPGITARVLTCLADGVSVTVAQGPITADGRTWWQLDGMGWAVADYLTGVTAPAPTWKISAVVIVDAGEGDCLNLRETPGTAATVVACLPSGARLAISDGPRDADGRTWWQLDGRGWAAAEFLKLRE